MKPEDPPARVLRSPGSDPASLDADAFEELARLHGTPFFLYDADLVIERINDVRKAFDSMVAILYAVKANPNLGVLRAIRPVVDGLDVSSAGEIEQALAAGYIPDTLSFAGPAKTVDELASSIGRSIGCISVESPRELAECVRIARALKKRARIALRVNPVRQNRSFGLKMGGKPVQFGIDEEVIEEAARYVGTHANELSFEGIHVYSGSQCFDLDGLVDSVANTLSIARQLESKTPLRCATVNLGGGFGVSHADQGDQVDVQALADALRPILAEFRATSCPRCRIVFELGRFLTASAGIYVSRVISRKSSRGREFAIVDGGLHHHLAAAGTFGAMLRSNYALRNLTRPANPPVRCSIAGPSCNPTDLLGVDVDIPGPELGDLIAVLNAGSYGLTASPVLFLGRNTAAEFVRHNGAVALARRPHAMAEFN